MKLAFTREEEAFREEVRDFLDRNLSPSLRAYAKRMTSVYSTKPVAMEWQSILVKQGWAAPSWPVEYGGTDWSVAQRYIFDVEMARAGAPPLSPMGIGMCGPALIGHGSKAQKDYYLPRILSGADFWCQGYSEPHAGSDLAALTMSAVEDGDSYICNGSKIWTTHAHEANMMFCLVRTDSSGKQQQGITFILIDMTTPGVEVRPFTMASGEQIQNAVFFTDVRVPTDQIVGERGQGWFVANATLKHERGMLGDPNAAMNRLKAIIDIFKTETIDGQRLMDHPLYLDRLMKLQADVIAMQAHGLRLLTLSQKKEPSGLAGLIVKLQGCELNHQLAALAIDALGEIGALYHNGPHVRDGGVWQHRYMFDLGLIIGGGTAQIQKNIIAEHGLGLPREPKPAKA
jgi:hypothetical protein